MGSGDAVLEQVDLSALVAEVVAGLDAQLSGSPAEVRVDDGTVVGDRVLLRLLLQNLIENAIRFRDSHRRQLVEVGLTRHGQGVELSVTDCGVGLEPEQLEGLFDPTRVRRFRRGGQHGTGVGLHTCRQIAERHGGSIRAEPQTCGARFVVWLPDGAIS